MVPGIDGLETYRKIIQSYPGQKAIIVSGFSETERVREAQRLGVGTYLRKPYSLEKIGLAVRRELDRPAAAAGPSRKESRRHDSKPHLQPFRHPLPADPGRHGLVQPLATGRGGLKRRRPGRHRRSLHAPGDPGRAPPQVPKGHRAALRREPATALPRYRRPDRGHPVPPMYP